MSNNPFNGLIARINKKKPSSEPARHAKRAYQKKHFSLSFMVLVLTLFFLFIPLFVIIAYSFNEGKSSSFTGFSLMWYKKLFF
jgi:spermidine/putrescine transport system permease protein